MLQQDEPDDYVIATGRTHSVREFVETAFERAGLDWQRHVEIDPKFFRPAEVDLLVGDASKARTVLGWQPKTGFQDLVGMMVDADLAALGWAPLAGGGLSSAAGGVAALGKRVARLTLPAKRRQGGFQDPWNTIPIVSIPRGDYTIGMVFHAYCNSL